jgi:hypothetical protein
MTVILHKRQKLGHNPIKIASSKMAGIKPI